MLGPWTPADAEQHANKTSYNHHHGPPCLDPRRPAVLDGGSSSLIIPCRAPDATIARGQNERKKRSFRLEGQRKAGDDPSTMVRWRMPRPHGQGGRRQPPVTSRLHAKRPPGRIIARRRPPRRPPRISRPAAPAAQSPRRWKTPSHPPMVKTSPQHQDLRARPPRPAVPLVMIYNRSIDLTFDDTVSNLARGSVHTSRTCLDAFHV